ncbi:hypothetical protein BDP55DRAFT_421008 [Colletotrichum godetiae]|uniref:Uncharacterized protein n=1 Tax=Colletotrichum godetiae TaxID=1209918 RepID=A0AAJ0EQQ2_9PEZI|nr:uncharacterized protein BDP55DRAFT_421008 [Colletotrichum godetiae]KAK1657693.1 hypothetical protein BDP55DRAFT_421008 [Colletotrichum godetiae]
MTAYLAPSHFILYHRLQYLPTLGWQSRSVPPFPWLCAPFLLNLPLVLPLSTLSHLHFPHVFLCLSPLFAFCSIPDFTMIFFINFPASAQTRQYSDALVPG